MNIPCVVVTRPVPDHQHLMDQLSGLGLQAIHAPAFELEPHTLDDATRQGLNRCELMIAVSPMAARSAVDQLSPELLGQVQWLVPGAGTAAVLQQHGYSAAYPPKSSTSEALLNLQALEQVKGKTIGLLNARQGRRLLPETLAERGATVIEAEIYRRIALPLPPCLLKQLDLPAGEAGPVATLISSRNAFDHLADVLEPDRRQRWLKGRFIVSSARLSNHLQGKGAQRILVADGAGDNDMLDALARSGWC